MFKTYNEYWGEYVCNNYYDTCVLESGQTIRIEFQEEWSKSKYYYNVYLVTSNKRKSSDNTYLKSTGKDGLKGLIWARQKIIEFEQYIKTIHKNTPVVIYMGWDDNRRRDAYEKGLKKLGYKYNMVLGSKTLCKTI